MDYSNWSDSTLIAEYVKTRNPAVFAVLESRGRTHVVDRAAVDRELVKEERRRPLITAAGACMGAVALALCLFSAGCGSHSRMQGRQVPGARASGFDRAHRMLRRHRLPAGRSGGSEMMTHGDLVYLAGLCLTLGCFVAMVLRMAYTPVVRMAWRFRKQRNLALKREAEATAALVLKEFERRKWEGATYHLGQLIKENVDLIERMKKKLDEAEMQLAKTKIPEGM